MRGTVAELLRDSLSTHAHSAAQRFSVNGVWRTRSYRELAHASALAAGALRARGVAAGDRIALLLRTRADWTVIELAAAQLGASLVPLYPTATPAQIDDALALTAPAILIAEAGHVLPDSAAGLALGVVRIGSQDGDLGALAPSTITPESQWEARTEPESVFTIALSSGTTGVPKGCIILHRNYAAVLTMVVAAERHPDRGFAHRASAFVYLPLAHASARLQQLTSLVVGGEIVYGSGGSREILRQIESSNPTYLAGVPRLFETAVREAAGDPAKLRATFGGGLHYALSGGARLPAEVQQAYSNAEILIVDGYGLTESSTAVAIGTPHAWRMGSVGRPIPGVNVAIASDHEILVRGDNVFAGYLDDPRASNAVLRDGWLLTGDLGRVDADGFLYVTGRKKNVIVSSTGKNIQPEAYEERLRGEVGVADFVLLGDDRPYLIGLTGDPKQQRDPSSLIAALERLNAELAPPERVQKLILLGTALTVAAGELTASGKVVRGAVERNHCATIEAVYRGESAQSVIDLTHRIPTKNDHVVLSETH